MTTPDAIHYVRVPKGQGARAEGVRMVYVLAGKPYTDVLSPFAEAREKVTGKNPFLQFPFVVTGEGNAIYQSLAIMHHAAHGTPAWPSDPAALTQALSVAMGAYDLYQWFGSFTADDLAAKEKFEKRRAPQFFGALAEVYGTRKFATGDAATFADVIAHEAIAWCVRRNDVCKDLFEKSEPLRGFMSRFESIPAIKSFMEKQAAARAIDDSV
jgi:glutathione S-transferase